MISVSALLEAGYQHYHGPFGALYQKRVYDATGLRYHVTIEHGVRPPGTTEYFAPKDQFTRNGIVFNTELLLHSETIAEIEAFYADLWEAMRLDYYEKNGERHVPQPPKEVTDRQTGWEHL
jgi:hypothetical protein